MADENKQMRMRDASRANVVNNKSEWPYNRDCLNTGSLQRIADAVEKIADSDPWTKIEELKREVQRLSSAYVASTGENEYLRRSNAVLRGHVGRLKRQLESCDG